MKTPVWTESNWTRRRWLRSASLGTSAAAWGLGGAVRAQEPPAEGPKPIPIEDLDEAEVVRRLRDAGLGEPRRLKSKHFLALGDADDAFMRASLSDCEELTLAYLRHFQTRGFEVRAPERPLFVLTFRDERSFGRFLEMPSAGRGVAQPVGIYDRSTNLLSVFDWRNVPMASRAGSKNVQTLAHEATHQLTFNTGLLRRDADVPIGFVEGLGTYGEPRKTLGPSDLGPLNLQRADDMAKLRRSFDWIPVRDLIADDSILRGGLFGRVLLAYAECWALVHMLLHDAERTKAFRGYLEAIQAEGGAGDRLAAAGRWLGDLAALDRDLQAYAVRVVQSL